ncbi:conserved hypothetical protein [Pediculus humanus corporis]|uniref:Uncharacterized protein n=1 Tax=Pediculus humanus subsp. corporis TaxID=121224 RepID=E0VI12_PEDHC|nr:uncharacterized protein Phum_PHUM219220 [Pediculus humanus corporis]EEB13018.1 conserved hypothetical protein [Pediculus humanus corporis]
MSGLRGGPLGYSSDALEPEKKPVRFDINLYGAPQEVMQLITNIKDVAEQFLYHWKTFPIILPPPIGLESFQNQTSHRYSSSDPLTHSNNNLGGGDSHSAACHSLARRHHKHTNARDLFITPSFDELDAVAMDSKGEQRRLGSKHFESIQERGLDKDKYGKPKRLNSSQLESIQRWGEFEVDSLNFPGQVHKWRLSELMQKGSERSRDSLLNDLSLALRFIIVTAKGRLFSHYFSVLQAVKALFTGLLRLLDIFIGVPSLLAHNVEEKIREERSRYLVAELVCRPELEESLEFLCKFVKRQIRRAATEKFEIERESANIPISIPYLFLTPKGCELDLRLFSRDLMKKALPVLVSILERETRGWFLHFREKLISELRAQKLSDFQIEREVNDAVMKEYLQRVYSSILSHPDLMALGEGVPKLFVEQANSVVLMHRAVENVQKKLKTTKENLKLRLEYMHPVLCRIRPWMRDKLRKAEAKFIEECQWSAHEEALVLCNNNRLSQTVYFLNRDLTFMKEREPVLLKELRKVKNPTRSFHWLTQIWMPTHWIIKRSFQGTTEIIPTVLSSTPTSITTPRSDPSQPVFLVEKENVRVTTTRWPMWRWINYCHRTWAWTWNAMFLLGIVIPWCSPVSFRALFSVEPFMPDLELSQVNGTLFPKKSSVTPTLCSRLSSLWRHISKSRTHFETKPDTGFIGKGMTRHLNRIWNYIIKGFFGTLAWATLFPIICIVISGVSIVIALSAVLWMPMFTLFLHLFMAVLYDLDNPDPSKNKYFVFLEAIIWNILIQGCMQPIAAIIVGAIICPIISLFILAVAFTRYGARLTWDAAMFHLIIKKRGRIPASDSFVVKRIAGPGLASDYYYQIKPEQALASLEARMELDELSAYQHEMEQIIMQPTKDFSQFVECCFTPFSAQISKTGVYSVLEKECQDLLACLHEKLERRRRELNNGLSGTVRSKIKLTATHLKIALQQGALMLERFYPTHVLQRLPATEEEFWEARGLGVNDWSGLVALIFADIFSLDFLTPLDDTDTRFKLEPHPQVDLSRFIELVSGAELGSGPDLLGPVHAPRGNIQIHSPYLDVSAFNPRQMPRKGDHKSTYCVSDSGSSHKSRIKRHRTWSSMVPSKKNEKLMWKPWKRENKWYNAEKLVIPLPIPHPAHIGITIHNRDSDDPINLGTELCNNILKALEDSQVVTNSVARCKGGCSEESTETRGESTESLSPDEEPPPKPPQTLNWNIARRKNNSGTVRVDLASPEDISLDTDSSRVVFSQYGTTV